MTNTPPGPRGLSGVAYFLKSLRDPIGVAAQLKEEYGDVLVLNAGPFQAMLLNHPSYVEEVLGPKGASFRKDKRYRSTPRLLGEGILTCDGELWRKKRRIAQPAFNTEKVAGYAPVMIACAEKMLRTWRAGAERDVNADMMGITLAVVGQTLFGVDMTDVASAMASSFMVLLEHWNYRGSSLAPIPESVPTPRNVRFNRAVRRLEALLRDRIREREGEGAAGRDDLLAMFLRAKAEQAGGIDDQHLRDDFVTMVLAGYETSANSISWTLHLLATHPEVEARLVAELKDTLKGQPPAQEDLPKLRYLDAVITESLRLYPPVWGFGREAAEACEIGGYPVREGTQMFICPYLNHRDARFFDEPLRFNPDRWAGGLMRELPLCAYMPFGRGSRMCIGRSFAVQEAALILALILQRFRVRSVPGFPVAPRPGITLRPKDGLLMRIEER